jgi:hypothetical protein
MYKYALAPSSPTPLTVTVVGVASPMLTCTGAVAGMLVPPGRPRGAVQVRLPWMAISTVPPSAS